MSNFFRLVACERMTASFSTVSSLSKLADLTRIRLCNLLRLSEILDKIFKVASLKKELNPRSNSWRLACFDMSSKRSSTLPYLSYPVGTCLNHEVLSPRLRLVIESMLELKIASKTISPMLFSLSLLPLNDCMSRI